MSDIPQQETIVQYVTSSSQTQYTFAFYAPLQTDIQVYYQASNATPIPSQDILMLNVDYTVTYNADPITGGIITLLFTPTSGFFLTINRQVAASLDTNFSLAQNFNGANLDAALDRLLLLCQQNQNYALERNLSYIINTYLPNAVPFTQLPPLAQNQFWVGSGAGVVAGTIAQIPSASVLQAMLANSSPGTDGARIVGYYDTYNGVPTNVDAFLQNMPAFITTIINTVFPNALFKPGMMIDFGGTSAPAGWLLCDGSAISRTTYANLFAAIGTTWGIGDGSTTFNVPDYRRRTSVGSGGTATPTLGNTTGSVGGEENHTLTIAEMPSHTHDIDANRNTGTNVPAGLVDLVVPGTRNTPLAGGALARGGGQAHNTIQPSAVATRIIKT